MPLAAIRALIHEDLAATDRYIRGKLQSPLTLINDLTHHILSCGGKRLRPLLVLLCARACHYSADQHITVAAVVELIHTATLLHDDVVDHSSLRRGQDTAHMVWGNEASVLVGDFMYSRAFQLIVGLQNTPIMTIFAHATNLIAEGEIMQLINRHNSDITETAYYQVIERKTAKLFEVATQSGATLAQCSTTHIAALQSFGLHLGIAYQLIDDALDYSATPAEIGKNIGNDLTEGKPTLPLLYALNHSTASEAALLREAIQTGSCEHIERILSLIESTGAIQYTANAAKQYVLQAQRCLTTLPASPYRQALHDLADYVITRRS